MRVYKQHLIVTRELHNYGTISKLYLLLRLLKENLMSQKETRIRKKQSTKDSRSSLLIIKFRLRRIMKSRKKNSNKWKKSPKSKESKNLSQKRKNRKKTKWKQRKRVKSQSKKRKKRKLHKNQKCKEKWHNFSLCLIQKSFINLLFWLTPLLKVIFSIFLPFSPLLLLPKSEISSKKQLALSRTLKTKTTCGFLG